MYSLPTVSNLSTLDPFPIENFSRMYCQIVLDNLQEKNERSKDSSSLKRMDRSWIKKSIIFKLSIVYSLPKWQGKVWSYHVSLLSWYFPSQKYGEYRIVQVVLSSPPDRYGSGIPNFCHTVTYNWALLLRTQIYQIYFAIREIFHSIFLIPKPPFLGRRKSFQPTLALLELIFLPYHNNFLIGFSMFMTILKWEHQNVCIFKSTYLIRATVPCMKGNLLRHEVNLWGMLSSNILQLLALSPLMIRRTSK